jgi:hypothetical protein
MPAPGEKKSKLNIDVSTFRHGKTITPENSVVPAAFPDKLNGGSEPVEDDIVAVLP